MLRKWLNRFVVLVVVVAALYGLGRLYYRVTGGFTIGNITSTRAYDPRWETKTLSQHEKQSIQVILDQQFNYLGKGCQSYVFLSSDGNYVIKFFKYQRFRIQPWIDLFSFVPAVDSYRLGKIDKKRNKLEGFFGSWKLAFNELQPETGLLYVHLNKSNDLNKQLVIYDKMGFEHHVDLDQMEFLLQRKAIMLCPYIDELMAKGDVEEAKLLLSRILSRVLSEYQRGLGDNDHALMQNTGVLDGYPIHIDVGQFVKDEKFKDPQVYKQEIFNKTYKFRIWLRKRYPELVNHLETELRALIGDNFSRMQPHFKPHD